VETRLPACMGQQQQLLHASINVYCTNPAADLEQNASLFDESPEVDYSRSRLYNRTVSISNELEYVTATERLALATASTLGWHGS